MPNRRDRPAQPVAVRTTSNRGLGRPRGTVDRRALAARYSCFAVSILNEQVKQQVKERFSQRLSGPVQLKLYTRPGTGRLILPSGMGCATCDDARELAEDLQDCAPDLIQLEVIDVTVQDSDVRDLPTLALGFPGEEPRIRWQGLPAGH